MALLGIPFPEDEGGADLDTLAYAIAIQELARVLGLAVPLAPFDAPQEGVER